MSPPEVHKVFVDDAEDEPTSWVALFESSAAEKNRVCFLDARDAITKTCAMLQHHSARAGGKPCYASLPCVNAQVAAEIGEILMEYLGENAEEHECTYDVRVIGRSVGWLLRAVGKGGATDA